MGTIIDNNLFKRVLLNKYLLKHIKQCIIYCNRLDVARSIQDRVEFFDKDYYNYLLLVYLKKDIDSWYHFVSTDNCYHQALKRHDWLVQNNSQTFKDDFYLGMLQHPALGARSYQTATKVKWIIKNGYTYLLKDKLDRDQFLYFGRTPSWVKSATEERLAPLQDGHILKLVDLALSYYTKESSGLVKQYVEWTMLFGNKRLQRMTVDLLATKYKDLSITFGPFKQQVAASGNVDLFKELYHTEMVNDKTMYHHLSCQALKNGHTEMFRYLHDNFNFKLDMNIGGYFGALLLCKDKELMNRAMKGTLDVLCLDVWQEFVSSIVEHILKPFFTLDQHHLDAIANVFQLHNIKTFISVERVQEKLLKYLPGNWIGHYNGKDYSLDDLSRMVALIENVYDSVTITDKILVKSISRILSLTNNDALCRYLKDTLKYKFDLLKLASIALHSNHNSHIQYLCSEAELEKSGNAASKMYHFINSNQNIYKTLIKAIKLNQIDRIKEIFQQYIGTITFREELVVIALETHNMETLKCVSSLYLSRGRSMPTNFAPSITTRRTICNLGHTYFMSTNFTEIERLLTPKTFNQRSNIHIDFAMYFGSRNTVEYFLEKTPYSAETTGNTYVPICYEGYSLYSGLSLFSTMESSLMPMERVQEQKQLFEYVCKRTPSHHFIINSGSVVNLVGRIGDVDLVDMVIHQSSLFGSTTTDVIKKCILENAFKYGHLNLILHMDTKYHLAKYSTANLLRSLDHNHLDIISFVLKKKISLSPDSKKILSRRASTLNNIQMLKLFE
ncbi:hypothetical protein DFA_09881 [Cavenderia fasciculata]|uniref:Uncharacterized protein n=1 Tax=Cavenderia fasciculata TaxID=261658 RepID=F4Q8N9_CACFS|nr:uncharacterized protein DFA_09881 [Cavenderia fasciculata]EGG15058.1 hypothetical protein DFA_09881 [Cavenderia fasciculata]|eukprot:XP_004351778.1 hypothetical protein DFA_09881 [Cavenderia fasciculata]